MLAALSGFRRPRIAALLIAGALVLIANGSAGASTANDRARSSSEGGAPTRMFPVHVLPDRRYLMGADGRPFLLVGDAAWSLIARLKDPAAARYLADRKARGFDAVLVNLLEHRFAAHAPADAYGHVPFTTPGDFGTPNKAYFAHAQWVVSKARSEGLLVLLTPAYLGYEGGGEGWWQDMRKNGVAKLRRYGRYVGTLFRKFDNVVWVNGGDFQAPRSQRKLVDAVAEGIRSVDDAPQTFEGGRGSSALSSWDSRPAWLSLDAIYTSDSSVVDQARRELGRSTLPFFLVEASYENEGVDAVGVRQQAYQTILSGGTGALMGNRPIWLFAPGWQQALASPGSRSMTQLAAFFRSLRWWNLVPDVHDRLVTEGVESGAATAVAAVSDDRSFAVVYVPTTRGLTLDLSQLAGRSVTAEWIDPLSGRVSAVEGSPFPADTVSLLTPRLNDGGDVVLLLRAGAS